MSIIVTALTFVCLAHVVSGSGGNSTVAEQVPFVMPPRPNSSTIVHAHRYTLHQFDNSTEVSVTLESLVDADGSTADAELYLECVRGPADQSTGVSYGTLLTKIVNGTLVPAAHEGPAKQCTEARGSGETIVWRLIASTKGTEEARVTAIISFPKFKGSQVLSFDRIEAGGSKAVNVTVSTNTTFTFQDIAVSNSSGLASSNFEVYANYDNISTTLLRMVNGSLHSYCPATVAADVRVSVTNLDSKPLALELTVFDSTSGASTPGKRDAEIDMTMIGAIAGVAALILIVIVIAVVKRRSGGRSFRHPDYVKV